MNQRAFVELEIIKNEKPFRALLPVGAAWADAHEALLQLAEETLAFQKQLEEQARLQEEAKNAVPAEESAPIEAEVVTE